MGLGRGWVGLGWDLCVGLLYEHRFAVLIKKVSLKSSSLSSPSAWSSIPGGGLNSEKDQFE